MKLYLRIIRFGHRLKSQVPAYIFTTLLGIFFSLFNFTLLIPFLDILFGNVSMTVEGVQRPSLELSMDSLKGYIQYFLVGQIEQHGHFRALALIVSGLVLSFLLTNVFRYVAAIILAAMRVDIVTGLRRTAYNALLSLDLGYFTEKRRGDLMSRMGNDILEMEHTIVNTAKVAFKEPVTILAYFGFLFAISWELTVFSVAVLPITGGLASILIKRLRRKALLGQESVSRLIAIMDETLGAMRIVKAFNARHMLNKRFQDETQVYSRVSMSMYRKVDLASPLSEFMGITVLSFILLYGGSRVFVGSITASEFIVYLGLYSQILPPIKNLTGAFSSLQRGLVSGTRVFEIVDQQPTVNEKPDAVPLRSFEKDIRFENVSFAYGDTEVLTDVNLTVEKGQTVALVGPSGAGKSTMADLIPRFYDPNKGRITIDGVAVSDLQIESLRHHIGMVTQESILFNDTVLNNITFGSDTIDPDRAVDAAKVANAHEFIEALEGGYEATIGEGGGKLSGGQRQRLSIARAVYKDPAILILDEATSALDSESEHLVQQALTELMKGRTAVVIAHRLSTIQSADLIVVMDRGRIVETGTHAQLQAQGGLYAKFTAMQAL